MRSLLILCLCTLCEVTFSQAEDDYKQSILARYGIEEMSPAGQDTIMKYVESHSRELFALDNGVLQKYTYPEIKQIFHAFFEDKLISHDLELIDSHWDRRHQLYQEGTVERGQKYCRVLACQRLRIDSFLQVQEPLLLVYRDNVLDQLGQENTDAITDMYRKSLLALENRRMYFLKHEEKFTRWITPCIYDYTNHAFDLMRDLPCANYYNFLKVNLSQLDRFDSAEFSDYYAAYSEFEIGLTKILQHPDCYINPAYPLFVEAVDAAEPTIFRKRNALLYVVRQFITDNPISADTTAHSMADSIRIRAFHHSDTETADLVDFSLVEPLGLERFLPGDEPGVEYFVTREAIENFGPRQTVEMFVLEVLHTPEEQKAAVDDLNRPEVRRHLHSLDWEKGEVYFKLSREELRDASTETIQLFGVITCDQKLIRFTYMGEYNPDYNARLRELLTLIHI